MTNELPEVWVDLEFHEITQASISGVFRHVQNLKKQERLNSHGHDGEDSWQRHIEGALAECAVAKYLGFYWPGKGDPDDVDVRPVNVRMTEKHSNRLILHGDKYDPPETIVFFVTGKDGRYWIRGWELCGNLKTEDRWQDPKGGRPAYFIPPSALIHPSLYEGARYNYRQ
jgi:hypothetical protein